MCHLHRRTLLHQKKEVLLDEYSHAPSILKRHIYFETGLPFRRFWGKEPRHSENQIAEMCPLYRRTRQSSRRSRHRPCRSTWSATTRFCQRTRPCPKKRRRRSYMYKTLGHGVQLTKHFQHHCFRTSKSVQHRGYQHLHARPCKISSSACNVFCYCVE